MEFKEATERTAFENATWAYYQGLKTAGWEHADEGDPNSMAALFWRMPSGQYGVHQIQAAWMGWKMRAMHVA